MPRVGVVGGSFCFCLLGPRRQFRALQLLSPDLLCLELANSRSRFGGVWFVSHLGESRYRRGASPARR